jgi:hypothetical protein
MTNKITWSGASYAFIVEILTDGVIERLSYRSIPADVMRVERLNKKAFLADGVPSYTALMTVAYIAARRLGLTDERDENAWYARVQDFGFEEREDEIFDDPHSPGSTGSSSPAAGSSTPPSTE